MLAEMLLNFIMSFAETPGYFAAMSYRLSPDFTVYVVYPEDVFFVEEDLVEEDWELFEDDGPDPFL